MIGDPEPKELRNSKVLKTRPKDRTFSLGLSKSPTKEEIEMVMNAPVDLVDDDWDGPFTQKTPPRTSTQSENNDSSANFDMIAAEIDFDNLFD